MGPAVSVIFIKWWYAILLKISKKVLRNVFIFKNMLAFVFWTFLEMQLC